MTMDTVYRAQASILMWLDSFCANKSFLQEEVWLEQIEHVHCKPRGGRTRLNFTN